MWGVPFRMKTRSRNKSHCRLHPGGSVVTPPRSPFVRLSDMLPCSLWNEKLSLQKLFQGSRSISLSNFVAVHGVKKNVSVHGSNILYLPGSATCSRSQALPGNAYPEALPPV